MDVPFLGGGEDTVNDKCDSDDSNCVKRHSISSSSSSSFDSAAAAADSNDDDDDVVHHHDPILSIPMTRRVRRVTWDI
jgi:hypothetical protein